MIHKFSQHFSRRGRKRQIPESIPVVSATASDESSLKTIVPDICHQTTQPDEDEARHDPTSGTNERSSDRIESEQREPIKTHRRTCATDWNELTSRSYNSSSSGSRSRQHHRRSLALTKDELTDVTMVVDELHGPFQHSLHL